MFDSIFFIIFLILILLIFGTAGLASIKAAPWVPTHKKDIRRMLDLGRIKKGDLVYDLGAGDGRLVLSLAKEYQAKVVGFEYSLLPYLVSKLRVIFSRISSCAKILYKDFLKEDLSKADVIVCFLTPWAMKKLAVKFEKELKPGTKIISYAFEIKNWKPQKISKPSQKDTPIFLYVKK